MLDRKILRNEPELVTAAIADKNEKTDYKAWVEADSKRRTLMLSIEELRSERNALSKAVALKKKSGGPPKRRWRKAAPPVRNCPPLKKSSPE